MTMTLAAVPRPTLVDAGPLAQLRSGRLSRRLPQLYGGLVLYGLSLALMVHAHVGLAPWDVLHSGLTGHLPFDIGQVLIGVSFVVLLLWIPLRELPGLGTISNPLVIGLTADATLAVLPPVHALGLRIGLMLAGVVLNAVATAAYIGSQLGRGPRDGLMTGLVRRTGLSIRLVRTSIEAGVVVLGLLLGGGLGAGTVLYALAIGPLTQAMLPALTVRVAAPQ